MVLTACNSTTAPSAIPTTPVKTVERAVMPPVPSELLAKHERPERPAGGSPEQLLSHAVRFGAYVQQTEAQVQGWQEWYEAGRLNKTAE